MPPFWSIVLLGLVFAALSFFLSGLEAGVFALNPARIRHWMRKGRPGAARLHAYLQQPEDFLWTTLVGGTLANLVLVALVVWVLHTYLRAWPAVALACFAVAVFLIYATCDLLPKMLFRAYPNRLCLSLMGAFRVVHAALRPVVGAVDTLSRVLVGRRTGRAGLPQLAGGREEMRATLRERNPALNTDEQAMIARVLDLNSVKVGELAVPLGRVVTVESTSPMSEVLRLCREHNLTRLPVWQGEGASRRIVGVVSLKSLLYQESFDPARPAAEHLKPAVYVEEQLPAEEALRRLQRSGQRLAIVLGAGRRETGVISPEDILRFVFGGMES